MKGKAKTSILRFLAVTLSVVTMLTMFPAFGANATKIDAEPALIEEQSVKTATVEPRGIGNNAGLGMAYYNITVYTDTSRSATKGTIYKHEGFTILENTGSYMHVQYSTSGAAKDGYIFDLGSVYVWPNSCLARITTSANVYYGQSEYIYERVGSVTAGEYVVVLARQFDWDYIEYNTSSGRKRGYIRNANLTRLNTPAVEQDLPCNIYYPDQVVNVSGNTTVYAGPTNIYYAVGSVGTSDNPLNYCNSFTVMGSRYVYVEYSVSSGKLKSGYIRIG